MEVDLRSESQERLDELAHLRSTRERLSGDRSTLVTAMDPQVLALNKHLLNQGAMQMFGAFKLSGLAGAGLLSQATALRTGRVS